ncbi:unnamed protein product, partial [Brassica rapa subsp. trilocularis]
MWKYDGEKDSVLQVTKEAYINCNTTNPAASYTNGDSKARSFTLSSCHLMVVSSLGALLLEAQAVPPATGSASSLTSRIGVLAFVGLAIVLL